MYRNQMSYSDWNLDSYGFVDIPTRFAILCLKSIASQSVHYVRERERERSSHWRSLVRYWGKAGADRTSVDVVHNMQLRELCTKWSQHYLHPCPEVFQENSQCWLVFRIIALAFQWSERYNASAGTVDVFAILLFRDVRVHFGPWLVMQIVEIG